MKKWQTRRQTPRAHCVLSATAVFVAHKSTAAVAHYEDRQQWNHNTNTHARVHTTTTTVKLHANQPTHSISTGQCFVCTTHVPMLSLVHGSFWCFVFCCQQYGQQFSQNNSCLALNTHAAAKFLCHVHYLSVQIYQSSVNQSNFLSKLLNKYRVTQKLSCSSRNNSSSRNFSVGETIGFQ